jgi:hypothetical protein
MAAAAAGEQGEQLWRDVIQNPVSDEVHASAKKIFDAMNAKLGPLLGFDVSSFCMRTESGHFGKRAPRGLMSLSCLSLCPSLCA